MCSIIPTRKHKAVSPEGEDKFSNNVNYISWAPTKPHSLLEVVAMTCISIAIVYSRLKAYLKKTNVNVFTNFRHKMYCSKLICLNHIFIGFYVPKTKCIVILRRKLKDESYTTIPSNNIYLDFDVSNMCNGLCIYNRLFELKIYLVKPYLLYSV